jgi:hypothetical protein
LNKTLLSINRKKERKRDLKFESEIRKKRRKGKEEEEEERGKNKGRRRELEKISLKCNIYVLMCINVFFLFTVLLKIRVLKILFWAD